MSKLTITVSLALLLVSLAGHCYCQLQRGFYKDKCNENVKRAVRDMVRSMLSKDPSIVSALLRMQFHDCFVNGCDASILLDVKNGEKTSQLNFSIRGYEVIDAIKSALESICPGVVSCADIIIMATRDAIFLSQGGWYDVETGRRDGLNSSAENVILPLPTMTVPQGLEAFAAKGFNSTDMVYLLGSHTVGFAHCPPFQDRLYNFNNTGKPDPTMNQTLLKTLQEKCPPNTFGPNTTFLDQNPASSFVVDNSYYQQLQLHNGVLQIDQELALDSITKSTVESIANGDNNQFFVNFGLAMIKLGTVDVLTGSQGEIRKSCRATNN